MIANIDVKWRFTLHRLFIKIEALGVQCRIYFESLRGRTNVFVYELLGGQTVGQQLQTSTTLADSLILLGSFGRGRREKRGARAEKDEGPLRTADCFQEFIVDCVFKSCWLRF